MEDARGDSMVARIARVLAAFDEERDSLTLTELAAGSGLAVPTAYRIARDLGERRAARAAWIPVLDRHRGSGNAASWPRSASASGKSPCPTC